MLKESAGSDHFDVVIVGAGVTGIGAAYHLGRRGISHVILEAAGDLGGIWRTHRWPGARCDSEFIQYAYSFRPLPSDRSLLPAEEIHRYLRSVAGEFGIAGRIRFGTRVEKAAFDQEAGLWRVHTNREIFSSRFLLNANGYFSDPHVPAFRDLDRFHGEILHAFELDGDRSFADRDVVLVGSGATAICCAPELAKRSRSLVMVQRSPSYIHETSDRAGPIARACHELYRRGIRFPLRILRYLLICRYDLVFTGFRAFPRIARRYFRRQWLDAVGRQSFERDFSPRYNPWEQRVCVSVGLREMLRSGAIRVRTAEIDSFTETSLVLKGGEEIRCDVCVLATGFSLNLLKFELRVGDRQIGFGGRSFYKGLMMGGVPNYFQPVGVWHSAWSERIETAVRLAVRIMRHVDENGLRTVVVDPRDVPFRPRITPNYVMRSPSTLPRPYGTWELPVIDNLIAYRFRPSELRFS
jgi:cation diffusion facilitator CzcD-associated flavoprotein CzcO